MTRKGRERKRECREADKSYPMLGKRKDCSRFLGCWLKVTWKREGALGVSTGQYSGACDTSIQMAYLGGKCPGE